MHCDRLKPTANSAMKGTEHELTLLGTGHDEGRRKKERKKGEAEKVCKRKMTKGEMGNAASFFATVAINPKFFNSDAQVYLTSHGEPIRSVTRHRIQIVLTDADVVLTRGVVTDNRD